MTFFYAYLMGFPRISNYDGSFYEWSFDPNNPIETGYPAGWQFIGESSSLSLIKSQLKQLSFTE